MPFYSTVGPRWFHWSHRYGARRRKRPGIIVGSFLPYKKLFGR